MSRLSKAFATSLNGAGTAFSYDAMGRIVLLSQCLPSGCGNAAYDKNVTYSYDWAGDLISMSDPMAGSIGYTRSPAGDMTKITNETYSLTGGSGPMDLMRLAHASSSVPSTVKCSSEVSPAFRACSTTRFRNSFAASASSSRSRFFVNVVASHTAIVQVHPYEPANRTL